jgi:hypothetical protein
MDVLGLAAKGYRYQVLTLARNWSSLRHARPLAVTEDGQESAVDEIRSRWLRARIKGTPVVALEHERRQLEDVDGSRRIPLQERQRRVTPS